MKFVSQVPSRSHLTTSSSRPAEPPTSVRLAAEAASSPEGLLPTPSPPPEPPLQLFVRKRRLRRILRDPFREGPASGRRSPGGGGGGGGGSCCCSPLLKRPGGTKSCSAKGTVGNSGPGGCSRSRPLPPPPRPGLLSSSSEQLLVSRLSASDSKPSKTSSASLVSVGSSPACGAAAGGWGCGGGGCGGHGHGQQLPPTVLTPGPAGCPSPRAANCASSPAAGPQVRSSANPGGRALGSRAQRCRGHSSSEGPGSGAASASSSSGGRPTLRNTISCGGREPRGPGRARKGGGGGPWPGGGGGGPGSGAASP